MAIDKQVVAVVVFYMVAALVVSFFSLKYEKHNPSSPCRWSS